MSIPPPSGPVDPDEPSGLPADLQPDYVGPYRFPSTSRRRWAGYAHAVVGVASLALYGFKHASPTINKGFLVAGIMLLVLAAWHFLAAWPLDIDELDALTRAGIAVNFPIGHAAASLAWRGWRSRPVWRILLYSAEDPPLQRGIVEVDAVDGAILLSFSEDNPEDWSQP